MSRSAAEEFGELVTAYRVECARLGIDDVTAQHVTKVWRGLFAQQERLEAKVDGLETLVRQLMVALRSGAVGKWA